MSQIKSGLNYVVKDRSVPVQPCSKVGKSEYWLPEGSVISLVEVSVLRKGKAAINIHHHPRLKKLNGVMALIDSKFLSRDFFKSEPVTLQLERRYITTKDLLVFTYSEGDNFTLKSGTIIQHSGIDSDTGMPIFIVSEGTFVDYQINFSTDFNYKEDLELYF